MNGRMTKKIEERIAVIETEIKGIKRSLDSQREDFQTVFKKLDALDNKFAGKWVEKISIGSIAAIIASLVILLVTR